MRVSHCSFFFLCPQVQQQDESDQSGMIVVTKVVSPSPAYTAGVKMVRGDLVLDMQFIGLSVSLCSREMCSLVSTMSR